MKLAGVALAMAMSLAVTSGAWSAGQREDVEVSWSSPRRLGEASAPSLNVSFLVDGAPVSLRLLRNDGLVAPRAMQRFYAANGSVREAPLEAPPCYYTGGVDGDPLGLAGISTCGGALSGLVVAHGREMAITPASTGADVAWGSSRHAVVALEDVDVLRIQAGVSDFVRRRLASIDEAPGRARRLREREKLWGRKLIVELAVVNDAARYASFQAFGGEIAMTSNTLEVINGAAALYAGTTGFQQSVRVVVVSTQTFEKDPYTLDRFGEEGRVESREVLGNFTHWSRTQRSIHRDNYVLLTGNFFLRGVGGIAYGEGMCKPDWSANANRCAQRISTAECSQIVSHELGHNLGMPHDGKGDRCDVHGYVMSFRTNVKSMQTGFSECSVEAFNKWSWGPHVQNGECLARLGGDSDRSGDIKDHAGGLVPAFLLTALYTSVQLMY